MVIVGSDITELVEQENSRRNLAAALAVAEQREQERLALDLHDGPVQTLTALSLRLGTARRGGTIDSELIAQTEELISSSIRQLRMLLFQLTPPNLVSETLGACLVDHARHVLGPNVSVEIDDHTSRRLDGQITDSLFRIGQEALMNIAKHASATVVQISLYDTPRHVVVEIGDNGGGALPEEFVRRSAGHLGISGMQERARLLGGTCEVESSIGEGTTVFIRLPINLSNSSSSS